MKLKKHTICLFMSMAGLLLLVSDSIQAQRFSAGIIGGANASQIDGDQLAGFDKLGLTGGLKAIVNFESAFDLHIEFLYSQRGSKPDLFSPEYDPDIEISLRYLELPVFFTIGDWWQEEEGYHKVSAHAGLSYGRLITARTFDYYNPDEASLDLLVPYFNKNDLSWLAGISYRMNSHFGVTARYTRGIVPLFSPKKHGLQGERLLSYFLTFRFEYFL
ncbi:MAG: porin family protein [Saprospiraceae bacterium]